MARGALKIAVIGGGSSYTPELIEGYIKRRDALPIKEIWLVDVEEGREKVEIVGAMAARMVRAAGLDWKVSTTLNRREALAGADFVSTQFRVGLLDARIKDERIPLSHGVLGQETKGAGGLFKAFRTIPVILDIVKDMKELCPDAWLVNFTNPAGMVTEAAIFHGGWRRTIGLCNVPLGLIKTASDKLNTPVDALTVRFAGLNHFNWHRVWDTTGNERTAELIDLLYKPGVAVDDENRPKNIANIEFPYEIVRDSGMLPCYYHRYYYAESDMLDDAIKKFEGGKTRAEEVKRTEERLFALYKDPALDHKPEELSQRGGAYYSDAACELIASIYNDKKTEMVVSVANNGAMPDLPPNCVVEVSARITAHGADCYAVGALPTGVRGMVQHMKAMEQIIIDAAITGDYDKALHGFALNTLIPAGSKGKKILDQMLVAHKDYLPQFKDAVERIEREQPDTVAYVEGLLGGKG
ncbi:MAG: 6-phospho-beta-glucosidase [Defluviitaleaceae bacterium]|nr:6-phospho-beta-glucosidase [Defluviitaleaceae bacterium]MCL2275745.1 6-phospho-beta-glucosidase [Defluviitaleaceae bacterium]